MKGKIRYRETDKASALCPRCGQALKSMRCRIDESELYCPDCGHCFDARGVRSKGGK